MTKCKLDWTFGYVTVEDRESPHQYMCCKEAWSMMYGEQLPETVEIEASHTSPLEGGVFVTLHNRVVPCALAAELGTTQIAIDCQEDYQFWFKAHGLTPIVAGLDWRVPTK